MTVGYSLARATCLDFFLLYEVALPLAGVEITAECLFNHSTIRLNTPKYQKVTIYLSLKMGHEISVSWIANVSIFHFILLDVAKPKQISQLFDREVPSGLSMRFFLLLRRDFVNFLYEIRKP